MNWPKLENDFLVGFRSLLEDIEGILGAGASEGYSGAGIQEPHEHDTRIYFLDQFLALLGWQLGPDGNVSEEARVKAETTTFMDYVGVNPSTKAPVLILEAKAWDKPIVSPRGGKRPDATHRELIVEAIQHIVDGKSKNTSPVTVEWHENLMQIIGYVRDLKARYGHDVPRVVLGTGRWLLIFTTPVETFVDGDVRESGFRLFELPEFASSSREIFRLLSCQQLIEIVPEHIRPSQLTTYMYPDDLIAAYFATLVKYERTGSVAFAVLPRVLIYPAVIIQRKGGGLLTVLGQRPPITMNRSPGGDDLQLHIAEVEQALSELRAACAAELGRDIALNNVSDFPGFVDPRGVGTAFNVRRNNVRPFGRQGDEWIFVLGSWSHHMLPEPQIDCRFHSWSECHGSACAIGNSAISIPTTINPRAFFPDGSKYHCANQVVQDRRESRCLIAPLDTRICCRACAYQNDCWTEQELNALPCGR
jgi:hypothetical protein